MLVAGFDQSLNSSAVTFMEGGIPVGIEILRFHEGGSREAKLAALGAWWRGLLLFWKPAYVALEDVHQRRGKGVKTAIDLGRVYGALAGASCGTGPVVALAPVTWRSITCGDGGVDKAQVIAWVSARYGPGLTRKITDAVCAAMPAGQRPRVYGDVFESVGIAAAIHAYAAWRHDGVAGADPKRIKCFKEIDCVLKEFSHGSSAGKISIRC